MRGDTVWNASQTGARPPTAVSANVRNAPDNPPSATQRSVRRDGAILHHGIHWNKLPRCDVCWPNWTRSNSVRESGHTNNRRIQLRPVRGVRAESRHSDEHKKHEVLLPCDQSNDQYNLRRIRSANGISDVGCFQILRLLRGSTGRVIQHDCSKYGYTEWISHFDNRSNTKWSCLYYRRFQQLNHQHRRRRHTQVAIAHLPSQLARNGVRQRFLSYHTSRAFTNRWELRHFRQVVHQRLWQPFHRLGSYLGRHDLSSGLLSRCYYHVPPANLNNPTNN